VRGNGPHHHILVRFGVCGLLMLMLANAGCSTSTLTFPGPVYHPRTIYQPHQSVSSVPHVTLASWYGPGFDGHHTSNGEIFSPDELTAASRTLPLGSSARVTNLDNGKSVIVRVNDRGPYVRGRGIDLSEAAAQRVGFVRPGIARVRVTRLEAASADRKPPRQGAGGLRVHRRYSARYHRYRHRNYLTRKSNPVGTWLLALIR